MAVALYRRVFTDETSPAEDVHGDPLAGIVITPIRRNVPYADGHLRKMAEELAAETTAPVEHHLANLRKIDRGFCGVRR